MKLSTIITQTILLTGIIASPIANPDDESSNPLLEKRAENRICTDALKHKQCHLNNYQNCVSYWTQPMSADCYVPGPPDPVCAQQRLQQVHAHCRFYCSKIKNRADCEKAVKDSGIAKNPQGYCKNIKFC
ncbi:putative secreted protein [Wickerhamomyces ciferrii]|uniref:Secreted protein n=1 Tax=Wickerhamomyces ciferrii (strain ATCC 14091 / BCRC 22168 / CBS 111 / JCM 3599 / NBRC 0793 / NRRL Y-1031 F-60-10) TaxID=1206466 RepID=K0KJT7_WICCF|nr:uncharacterized protein BN7_2758 [Wickerhamomyces ciferrii]CCH43211.1 putative secreted protein [Wickerhamomyces ciferrii]